MQSISSEKTLASEMRDVTDEFINDIQSFSLRTTDRCVFNELSEDKQHMHIVETARSQVAIESGSHVTAGTHLHECVVITNVSAFKNKNSLPPSTLYIVVAAAENPIFSTSDAIFCLPAAA
jgi:hypothetical protein